MTINPRTGPRQAGDVLQPLQIAAARLLVGDGEHRRGDVWLKLLLPALVTLSLVAAGCLGGGAEPVERTATPPTTIVPDTPEGETPEPMGPMVATFDGAIAGVGAPEVGYFTLSGTNLFDFEVHDNTTALIVEVAWDATDKLDVQVDVPIEYCTAPDPVGLLLACDAPDPDDDGDSPARIVVTDAEMLQQVGEWTVGVWARQSPSEVPFAVYVTQFHETAPTEDYTAIETA